MYIRANKSGNRTYYYIVESVREGDKVKQKVILYLGKAETVLKNVKSKAN